ncbi:MAG: response regulator transcription factor [Candidatus Hydrogenedentes bacterium]|nr:response regulator transcription factor [Candidatus Hydrogenedentota bacterium]
MRIRLFIADDHAVFRSGLRALLEQEEEFLVVGETGSGVDTLKLLNEKDVDVLLLDISMPGLPGQRVAREALRAHPGLSIVVLTMHEDEYYLQELLRVGVRGYVLKKSTGSELVQAIRAVHRGNVYIDPTLAGLVVSPYVGRPASRARDPVTLLTPREKEVCTLLAYGHTNAEVAEKLRISDRTVETHRTNIMAKLELKSRADLVRYAIDNGLLKFD